MYWIVTSKLCKLVEKSVASNQMWITMTTYKRTFRLHAENCWIMLGRLNLSINLEKIHTETKSTPIRSKCADQISRETLSQIVIWLYKKNSVLHFKDFEMGILEARTHNSMLIRHSCSHDGLGGPHQPIWGSVQCEYISNWLPQPNGCCGKMYKFHSHINQDVTISGNDVVSHSKTRYAKFKLKHGSPIFCDKKGTNEQLKWHEIIYIWVLVWHNIQNK